MAEGMLHALKMNLGARQLKGSTGLILLCRQIFQITAHGILIRANEPPRAQFHAAEPSRHPGADLADAGLEQNLQHGAAGCAVRFPVIGETNLPRIARLARDAGPAMMGRIRIFHADGFDKSPPRLQA